MNKLEKRIVELENEVKLLRQQLLELAMRPSGGITYIPMPAPPATPFVYPTFPQYPIITYAASNFEFGHNMMCNSNSSSLC